MAVVTGQEKLIGEEEDDSQTGAGGGTQLGAGESNQIASGPAGSGGSGGASALGMVSGKGGRQGHVNLQAYMKANEGNTGSANALEGKFNSAFDSEQSGLQQKSDAAIGQASKLAAENKINTGSWGSQDQKIKLGGAGGQVGGQKPTFRDLQPTTDTGVIQTPEQRQKVGIADPGKDAQRGIRAPNLQYMIESASKYDPASQDYQDAVQGIRSRLSSQFNIGPVNYQPSDNIQKYQKGLSDESQFGGLMDSVYDDVAGGRITTGQRALQRQLDSTNDQFGRVKESALAKLSGLSPIAEQANSEIEGYKNEFNQNKDALTRALTEGSDYYRGGLGAAAAQANADDLAAGDIYGDFSADNIGGETSKEQRNRLNYIMDALGRSGEKVGSFGAPAERNARQAVTWGGGEQSRYDELDRLLSQDASFNDLGGTAQGIAQKRALENERNNLAKRRDEAAAYDDYNRRKQGLSKYLG